MEDNVFCHFVRFEDFCSLFSKFIYKLAKFFSKILEFWYLFFEDFCPKLDELHETPFPPFNDNQNIIENLDSLDEKIKMSIRKLYLNIMVVKIMMN